MLPLKLAYGTTIHSSQGQSLDKVIIKIGDTEFQNGLTYTAISRCKKIEFLSFRPMENYKRFQSISKSDTFEARKKQDKEERESDEKFMNGEYR